MYGAYMRVFAYKGKLVFENVNKQKTDVDVKTCIE